MAAVGIVGRRPHAPTPLLAPLLLLLLLCLLLTVCAAPSSPSNSSSPTWQRRSLVPRLPRLHVAFTAVMGSASHITLPSVVCQELVRRGHRVTWLLLPQHDFWLGSAEERATLPFTFRPAASLTYNLTRLHAELVPRMMDDWIVSLDEVSQELFEPFYEPTLRELQRLVEDDRPDVLMCDVFAFSCVDLADQLGIPFVVTFPGGTGDFGLGDAFDTPSSITGYSQLWHEQSMWHRFRNSFLILPGIIWYMGPSGARMNALRVRNGFRAQGPPDDKWRGHDILFNGNDAWDWAGYRPPYTHLIGPAMGHRQPQPLTADLQRWLDEALAANQPVVVLALGSSGFLRGDQVEQVASAFSSCPALPPGVNHTSTALTFRALWSVKEPLDSSVMASLGPSVRVELRIPQVAVLAHPATSVFITHAGSSSLQEGLRAGLPMLAIPLWGDQMGNAARLQDRGALRIMEKGRIRSADLCRELRHLAFDPQVRASADELQKMFHISSHSAVLGADILERAAVGQSHLLPYRERSDVSLVVRYNLDVYALGCAILLAVLYAIYSAGRLAVRFVMGTSRGSKAKVA